MRRYQVPSFCQDVTLITHDEFDNEKDMKEYLEQKNFLIKFDYKSIEAMTG